MLTVIRHTILCSYLGAVYGQVSLPAKIRVDAGSNLGTWNPVWAFFGYDEPNYTYTPNGRKLIGELAALHRPVYIRAHNLLTSGDGTPALKWGSTNAYTEDENGKPVYDWTIVDRIVDTYLHAGAKPFVEIGFMPQALSRSPDPYRHHWPKDFSTGWAAPPADFRKWGDLVFEWARHEVKRFGEAEARSWYWEVWNEPDISYWRGTPEEYFELYDYAADAVKRAIPGVRVGGPATTGPASEKAAAFLNAFLEHCRSGRNFATGKTGAPLDFITYHAKGQPSLVDGHVRMGLAKNLADVERGFEIVASFPQFRELPIVLSESDPEGCAACDRPQNAYRNGAMYPSYTAAALHGILELAERHHVRIDGMLTWAFEFENQPYFAGLRTLATNGIDKPILNFFRMTARMEGSRLAVQSDAGLEAAEIIASGVRVAPDVNAMATRSGSRIDVLMWNYHDDDAPGPSAAVDLLLEKVNRSVARATIQEYRIDANHSNSYTAWQRMGNPQHPTEEQLTALNRASRLEEIGTAVTVAVLDGTVRYSIKLPRQGVSLVSVEW